MMHHKAELAQKIQCLEEKLKIHIIDEDFFKHDDEKVCYYTGLTNWELLHCLSIYIKPHLVCTASTKLSPFQQLIALMRLWLSLSLRDLGYRFGIHKSTASCVFASVIDILYVRLRKLILWPE